MPPIPQSTLYPTSDEQSTSSPPPGSVTVYAFLATLGLFFFILAAIIGHTFIHRRRHQLMVEEAIRNRAWPPPRPVSKEDMDLSKKPGMWEIHLGGDAVSGCGFVQGEKAREGSGEDWRLYWDAIQPFSAAYVDPMIATLGSDPQVNNDHRTGSNFNLRHPTTTSSPPRPLLSHITHLLNLTSSSPLPTPTNTTASPINNDNNNNTPTTTPPKPSTVRIAVLIAMPFQRPQSRPSSPSLSSTSHTPESWHSNEEEELPYVNVGVAELPVLTTVHGPEESERKDSTGSSIDV